MLGKEKFVLTTPLLTDKSGRKIGKSEGNVIALTSSPHELYGMIMSLPDDVIGKSFEMITDLPMDEVNKIQEKLTSGDNPMLYKKKLAFELVRMLNDKDSAKKAQENFENTFQKKGESSDLKILEIPSQFTSLATIVRSGYVKTNSDGRRLLSQGAFELNGQKITDPNLIMSEGKIKIGKHGFYNVKINKDLK
jgi:tyrosyl-tRNA synthetase